MTPRRTHTDNGERPREGRYANVLLVGHSANEFVLDFGQSYAGRSPCHVHTRIVTNPACAKAMLAALQAAVSQFAASYEPAGGAPDRGRSRT